MGYRSASQPTGIRSEPRTRRNFIRPDGAAGDLAGLFRPRRAAGDRRRRFRRRRVEGRPRRRDGSARRGLRDRSMRENARNRAGARQFNNVPARSTRRGLERSGADFRRHRRRRQGGRAARGRRGGRRPDQSYGPPGFERLHHGGDRQSLAAGDRRVHGRRGAGVRAGGARAYRNIDPDELRRLGARGEELATGSSRLWPRLSRAAGFLAPLHPPRLRANRARADGCGPRRAAGANPRRRRRPLARPRHPGRRRAGRSGVADAQGPARARRRRCRAVR